MRIKSYVKLVPDRIVSDRPVPCVGGSGREFLVSAFRESGITYAKFYKMDTLSKVGFFASEILLGGEEGRFEPREDRAVILFNSSSSLCDDRLYCKTIESPDNWFPSPAVFVYTLPNIVTGEIAIRNKYYGETCFYVLPEPEPATICRTVADAFQDRMTSSAVCGWAECSDDDTFEAVLFLVERDEVPEDAGAGNEDGADEGLLWNTENIRMILNK